jgi:hypothetical protein
MQTHYRVGGKQPRNIYRVTEEHPDGEYIGVMFTDVDAAAVVNALNQIVAIGSMLMVPSD